MSGYANKAVVNPDFLNGKTVYVLGQTSGYPYEHLAVLVDGRKEVDPTSDYNSFTVAETSWGGMVFAIGFSQDAVINAVKTLSEALKNELLATGATHILGQEIWFQFEGVAYQCSMEAYSQNRIILPDGRILSAMRWLESMPPKPSGLHVIGNVEGAMATKA